MFSYQCLCTAHFRCCVGNTCIADNSNDRSILSRIPRNLLNQGHLSRFSRPNDVIMAVIELCGEIASKLICRSCVAFSERIEPVTRFIMHREFKFDFSHLSATSVRGLRLTQESVLPACGDHMCFNICHQMSALVGWGYPEVNKFESVSSDGH